MYTIGELSKICALSVKSLRRYHDKELLTPTHVDPFTSYRYYDDDAVEKARSIARLKGFGFSLSLIREILDGSEKGNGVVGHLKTHQKRIQSQIEEYKKISSAIDHMIQMEQAMNEKIDPHFQIEEKEVETLLVAGYRMKGAYPDVGEGFSAISRALGRYIVGRPMTLYYDSEYKETDADFEACFPVRKGRSTDTINIRALPGIKAVTLIHKGPFDRIGSAYQKIFAHIRKKGYQTDLPFRERYIKSPGMIFKGNPENYLTEIMIPIRETS